MKSLSNKIISLISSLKIKPTKKTLAFKIGNIFNANSMRKMELFLSFAKVLKSLVSIYFLAPNLKYLSIYLLCFLSNNLGINLLTFTPFKSDILYLKILSIF